MSGLISQLLIDELIDKTTAILIESMEAFIILEATSIHLNSQDQ